MIPSEVRLPWLKFAHEKNLLTNCLTGLYSNLATPHCVVGFGDPFNHDAQPRPYAVFLCVLHGYIVLMGYVGRPSGLSVRDTGSPTLHSPSPMFGDFGDGFKTPYHESAIMQNITINTSKIRPFALVCSFQVPTTDLTPDFTPSITVVIGAYQSQEEVIAARNAISSPALISASLYQSFESNASDALGGV